MLADELESAWQEFALGRIEDFTGSMNDVEAQFICYGQGFMDGLKLAMTIEKTRHHSKSRYQPSEYANDTPVIP
jgi:hypothetical protein